MKTNEQDYKTILAANGKKERWKTCEVYKETIKMNEFETAIFYKCRMCSDDEQFDLYTYVLRPLYKFKLFPGRDIFQEDVI